MGGPGIGRRRWQSRRDPVQCRWRDWARYYREGYSCGATRLLWRKGPRGRINAARARQPDRHKRCRVHRCRYKRDRIAWDHRHVETPYEFHGTTFPLVQLQNVGTANVKGFELGYNQAFNFLPGLLSGFGISSNFTYVDSSTHINASSLQANSGAFASANGVDTNGTIFGNLPLEGLSKYSYNLTGYYEKGIISIRLAYNWRSKYLLATNVNGTQGSDGSPLTPGGVSCGDPSDPAASHCVVWGLPTWNGSYGELDGSIFFKFNHDKISLGLEAQNLTNSVNRVLMQQSFGMMGRAWFQSDRRYTASVRVKF